MKHLLNLLIALFTVFNLSAQGGWGKADAAQWDVRVCPIDTSANAMVLIDSEYVSFVWTQYGLTAVYDVYKRIQIMNKEGFEYGTVKIPYYSHLNQQTFDKLEAQTLNKDEAGLIHITKLKSDAIFDEEANDFYSFKKFAFAGIKEGSILEYRYTLTSRGISSLNDWFFQSDIPTLRSAITLKIPEFVHYSPAPQGATLLNDYKTEQYNEWMDATVKIAGHLVQKQVPVTGVINYYAMKNIPALKPEAYLTTLDDYRARLTFPLYSITFPYQKVLMFGESWDIITQQLMQSDFFGTHLNESAGEHLTEAKKLTSALTDKTQKVKAVYDNLAAKMKWTGKTWLYPTKRLSKSYTEGNGNSADINLLLVSMLRAAGINADAVLVSTRSHGMIQKAYPTNRQFNNVVALAELDSGFVLLDATDPLKPYDMLSADDLNYQGLRITRNSTDVDGIYHGVWVDINPAKNAAATLSSTTVIDSAGNLSTKGSLAVSGYTAVKYRQALGKESVKDCLKHNVKVSDEVDFKEDNVENEKEADKRLKFHFHLEKANNSAQGNILYINPFPAKFLADNPFKLAQRTYPVDYGYPFQQNIANSIVIPANYKVSELPKSINMKLDDGSATFSFLVGQVDNNIQINTSLKINKSQFATAKYDDLKTLYAKVIDAYNSTIVLEKSK